MTSQAFALLVVAASAATFGGVFLAPAPTAAEAVALESAAAVPQPVADASVYYPGCNAVRAAGKAPLYRSQPGYRPEMDGDHDGIACEPHF